MAQTTKLQHYVWRNYLKRWTDTGDLLTGKLYVLRKQPRGNQASIEFRELTKVGAQNYYYSVTNFSDKDKILLTKLTDSIQKNATFKFDLYPEVFTRAATEKDFLEKEVIGVHENIDNAGHFLDRLSNKDYSFFQESPLQDFLNTIRDLGIENPCDPFEMTMKLSFTHLLILCACAKEMLNQNKPDPKRDFMQFFYMQYFRSPKYRQNMQQKFEILKQNASYSQELIDIHEKFLTNMLSTFFAEKIAFTTMQQFQISIRLFDNQTQIPFLTGDSPIFNLFEVYDRQKSSLMYYPISPKVAITLHTSKKKTQDCKVAITSEKLVEKFNSLIVRNCVNEIYSNSEEYLRSVSD